MAGVQKIQFLKNEELKTIKPGFKGTPLKGGKFTGTFESRKKGLITKSADVLRFLKNSAKREKQIEQTTLPIIKDKSFLDKKEDFIIWLGHASFLIQLNGKKILTDPCFSSPPFVKRDIPAPMHIKELGDIDYLLISHGHHDHLDLKTIKAAKNSIKEALLPLKMGRLIKRANHHLKIQEAGWYQQYKTEGVDIIFLPAHHWHRRTPFDTNKILWGSFIIKDKRRCIYFAGDSGYNIHFKEIGEMFAPIDYALMPINPPFIIGGSHMNHDETIKAIRELDSKIVIPMHYGAFKFTRETSSELILWFKDLEYAQKTKGKTLMPAIGEIINLEAHL